jgi:hypothetical protein
MKKIWMKLFTIMDGSLFEVGACAGKLLARLEQIQFGCPVDGRTTIIDAKLTVDALGMGTDRADGDYDFTSDLRHGKLRPKQAEYFEFTLAERLDQFGWLPAFRLRKSRQDSIYIPRQFMAAAVRLFFNGPSEVKKQGSQGFALIHKEAEVAFGLC